MSERTAFDDTKTEPFLRYVAENIHLVPDDADLRLLIALAVLLESASRTPEGIPQEGFTAQQIQAKVNHQFPDRHHVVLTTALLALDRLVASGILVGNGRLYLQGRYRLNEEPVS